MGHSSLIGRSKMFSLILILSVFSLPTFGRDIRSTETQLGYYCRQTNSYKICLTYPDITKPEIDGKKACNCDHISIKDSNNNFVGGSDCKSKGENVYGNNYCFVDKKTAAVCNERKDEDS